MWKKFLKENLEMILIALAIVLPIRFFVMQPFVVHGSSMEPTYLPRTILLLMKFRIVFVILNGLKLWFLKLPIRLNNII